jgi:putative PIN family toxin of toxin-antitoxin system
LARVLRRSFARPETEIQRIIRLVAGHAQLIEPRTTLAVVVADSDDNRVLECAVDGKADLIVSNDHHLLDLKSYRNITVIATPDFRRVLGLK